MGAQTDLESKRVREVSASEQKGKIWQQFLHGTQAEKPKVYQLASPAKVWACQGHSRQKMNTPAFTGRNPQYPQFGHRGFMACGFRWILDKAIITADLRWRSLNFAIGKWLWVT